MNYRLAPALLLACTLTQLSGCFFVFIPGALINAAADKVTGSEGAHCVGPAARVGDRINVSEGTGTVQSLSGTSSRCSDTRYPIRAKLAFAS